MKKLLQNDSETNQQVSQLAKYLKSLKKMTLNLGFFYQQGVAVGRGKIILLMSPCT